MVVVAGGTWNLGWTIVTVLAMMADELNDIALVWYWN